MPEPWHEAVKEERRRMRAMRIGLFMGGSIVSEIQYKLIVKSDRKRAIAKGNMMN